MPQQSGGKGQDDTVPGHSTPAYEPVAPAGRISRLGRGLGFRVPARREDGVPPGAGYRAQPEQRGRGLGGAVPVDIVATSSTSEKTISPPTPLRASGHLLSRRAAT